MSLSRKDLEDLEPVIDKAVYKVTGSDDSSLVKTAINCLYKGYDKDKTIYKLEALISSSKASRLADKLFAVHEDYVDHRKSRKRKEDKHRKYEDDYPKEAKKKREDVKEETNDSDPSPGQLTADKIKDMMAKAKTMIAQKKQEINFVEPAVPSFQPEMSEKGRRAAELQAKIQATMGIMSLPSLSGEVVTKAQTDALKQAQLSKPTPLILDEFGRTIDATTGEAVQLTHHAPTLKANIRAKRREQFKSVQDKPPEEISDSLFFDSRVGTKGSSRTKRSFKFHEKGKFESIAQKLRTKAQLERLQGEIAHAAKKTGIASAAKLATIQPKHDFAEGDVPDVEWWDSVIMKTNSYDIEKISQVLEGITQLVEHPIQMKPPAEPTKQVQLPVMLTKIERKKLRRQNRSENLKEEQEKIRLGLLPPPEPKVRMANLMRVLGTEAVQDPTKIEAHVRAQMAKRQKAHEESNASRKLTTEQRKDKKAKKIKENTRLGVNVAVYRLKSLKNPSNKFKIEANCKQLFMTGFVILNKDCNVVVVEGGPKQQNKFKRLMLHRINWSNEKKSNKNDEDSDDEGSEMTKECVLVWEGTKKNRAFSEIIFKMAPTELFAREQFRKHGVEEYWDLAFKGAVLEAAEEVNL